MKNLKLKIKYMSDNHQEFGSHFPEYYSKDTNLYNIFVIAGDFSNFNSPILLKELAELIAPKPLLYVTGNHDYYHSNRVAVDKNFKMLDEEVENFHFLNHNVLNFMGVNFIGCTGWQNIEGYNSYDHPINDFNLISDHPKNIHRWGKEDHEFLESSLKEYKNTPMVIVTHVPPISDCVDKTDSYFNDTRKMADSYHNNYENLIIEYKPILWIHGHMHNAYHEKFHKTMITRNPFGYMHYKKRKNAKFDLNRVININVKEK